MGYSSQVIRGFSWQTVLKVVMAGITFVKLIVLARLLSPAQFGVFSLVSIALGITESTTQTGVNVTLLQVKDSLKQYISSAWVISIVRGFLMSGIMIVLGYVLREYYQNPELLPLTIGAAVVPAIKGFINPYIIVMQKEFQFSKETLYYSVLQGCEAICAILLATVFHSPWVFIISMAVAAVIEVGISFVFFEHKPSLRYTNDKGSVILTNARHFSLNALLSYLLENLDNLIIGKVTNTNLLGLYHNGYALGHKANYEFAKSFHHGALPVFSKIEDDKERLTKGFYKLLSSTFVFTLLLSLPLLIIPEFLVNLALGAEWLGMVPSLRWLVAAGIVQSCILIQYTVLFAAKKISFINAHLVVSLMMMIPFIVIGSSMYGLVGGAIGLFLSRFISLPLLAGLTYKTLR